MSLLGINCIMFDTVTTHDNQNTRVIQVEVFSNHNYNLIEHLIQP